MRAITIGVIAALLGTRVPATADKVSNPLPVVTNIENSLHTTPPTWEDQIRPILATRVSSEAAFEADKQAKAQEQARLAIEARQQQVATVPVYTPVVQAPSDNSSDKAFIYSHESGNDPKRYNGSGCVGLGQACPGAKLLAVCPGLDYSCEDNFFTNYMISRYGTWANAKAFWIRTDCRPYCGNWW